MLTGLNLPLQVVYSTKVPRAVIVDAGGQVMAKVEGNASEALAEIMAASPETLRVFEDLLDLFQGIDGGENEDNEVFARAIAHRAAMRARMGLPPETIKEG